MSYKIGIGYDIHRLVKGRKLFLGGLEIPYSKGLLGHSDGDVLMHAIIDALLGAMGQGDIGEHFPDTDPRYRGISSRELLKKVKALIKRKFVIQNLDSIIITQTPRLAAFKKRIEKQIARILKINPERVNIKAKTNEGIGEIGKGKAIAAYAVAIISKKT